MTEAELARALDGIYAYDTGATDSGIHDEALRKAMNEHLAAMPEAEERKTVARIVRDLYLSDRALDEGYGAEDVHAFWEWYEFTRHAR